MKHSRKLFLITVLVSVLAWADFTPIPIDFFGTEGCETCQRLKSSFLPEILENYAPDISWKEHDTQNKDAILLLLAYRAQHASTANESVAIVVDRQELLEGETKIRSRLTTALDEALQRREIRSDYTPPPPPETDINEAWSAQEKFTWGTVIAGGLIDGINPCALTTLVFFLTLLSLSRVTTLTRIFFCIGFILTSFIIYTLLGFGFIRLLSAFPFFQTLRHWLLLFLVILLVIAGTLSLIDAWRMNPDRGSPSKTPFLGLPERFRLRIQNHLKSGINSPSSFLGGCVAGAAVTLLESVCTGQSYIPVLTLILKHAPNQLRIWGMLLLYNALFILPLIIAAFLCHYGLKAVDIASFNRRHIRITKFITGCFFILLAFLLILLK